MRDRIFSALAEAPVALFNATCVRVRDYPTTLEKHLAGLPASEVVLLTEKATSALGSSFRSEERLLNSARGLLQEVIGDHSPVRLRRFGHHVTIREGIATA